MTKTISGIEIKSTTKEREAEIANIINTYELLQKATTAAIATPAFGACYNAEWTYYADHYNILSKLGDPL